MKTKKTNMTMKRGFTLVETLIAILLFSLAMLMLMGTFSGFLKTYASAKKSQRSAESAQYAMNTMAQTIRSGVIYYLDSIDSSTIKMLDNANSVCVEYAYEPSSKKIQLKTSTSPITIVADCSSSTTTWTDFSDLTKPDEVLSLNFAGAISTTGKLGKITISMSFHGNNDLLPSQMQTTVSLRQ